MGCHILVHRDQTLSDFKIVGHRWSLAIETELDRRHVEVCQAHFRVKRWKKVICRCLGKTNHIVLELFKSLLVLNNKILAGVLLLEMIFLKELDSNFIATFFIQELIKNQVLIIHVLLRNPWSYLRVLIYL